MKRVVVNNYLVYYRYKFKYILINVTNGKWLIFNTRKSLINTISQIENNNLDVIKNLTKKGFFNKVQVYKNPTLHLYVTNKCNLRCPHCYMRCENGLDNELTTNELLNLISDFKNNGGERIVFSGGELSLHKDFSLILKHSKNLSLENILITNGTLWDDATIKNVSQYADCIQISIDGYNEETNSKIRGIGSFYKSLNAIDKFLKAGVEVVLTITPLYGFEKEKENYVKFGKSLIDKYKQYNFYIVVADGLYEGRNVKKNRNSNSSYANASQYILNKLYPGYAVSSFAQIHQEALQNCGYGKIAVDSNGDFSFCTCVKDIPVVGNIRNTPMTDIVKMANVVAERTSVENIVPCNVCDFRYICGGGCRMDNFHNANKIYSIDNIPELELIYPCVHKHLKKLLKLMLASIDKI